MFTFIPFPIFPVPYQPGSPAPHHPNHHTPPPPPPSHVGHHSNTGAPTGPPPTQVPQKPSEAPGLKAVDPGSIRYCRHKYTYLWLDDGRHFWAWPTYVGRTSLAGYRWIGFRWVYFGVDLKKISDFICY